MPSLGTRRRFDLARRVNAGRTWGVGSETIWDLLHAGDWACANGDEESLARVARALTFALTGEQRLTAYTIATVAELDIQEATRRWGELTDELRAQVSTL